MVKENKFDLEIRTDAVDFSFGELVNLHVNNEIVIAPEYQRLFRWSDEQRSRLVESIIIKLPIPPIFLVENDEGVLELIDGLQRISSVIQFIDPSKLQLKRLKLSGCDIIKELNDKFYDDLPLVVRLQIKRAPIRAIIIRKQGNSFIKYELFKRLNTGGALLSAQEVRNCSSRMVEGGGEFYKLIQKLASYDAFKSSTKRLPDTTIAQKGDEELVLRFFAVRNYLDNFKGNVQEWLDAYMEDVLFKRVDFSANSEARTFRKVFGIIHDKFGENAFVRYKNGQPEGRLAPAYFEAVIGGVINNIATIEKKSSTTLRNKISKLFESNAFKDVTGPGANTKEKLQGRIDLVTNAFK